MPYAIIRGANGRRHEVDFCDALVRVQIYHGEEIVEIFIEADSEMLPEERRRFAVLNIPRHLFSEATAATTRRAANPVLHPRTPNYRKEAYWAELRTLILLSQRAARQPSRCGHGTVRQICDPHPKLGRM
jgi:hypothetical protein